jgi:hypothetical protein
MQTKNIIQTVANVIKITSLKRGDVVKMIDKDYSSLETKYAVVLDLLNDGENTFIQLLKYSISYRDINAEIKTYKGGDDLSLFPTNKEEVEEYFKRVILSIDNKIEEKKKELQELITSNQKAKEFISGELSKTLSNVEYIEQTQDQYNQSKIEKENKVKELMNL